MPMRPFPFPLSIGTDIVSIPRVYAILQQGHGSFRRYIRRFLTDQEQRPILSKYGAADLSNPAVLKQLSHFLAGRWAAKEATIKAATWRQLGFHEIIICRQRYGRGSIHAIILDQSNLGEPQIPQDSSRTGGQACEQIDSGASTSDMQCNAENPSQAPESSTSVLSNVMQSQEEPTSSRSMSELADSTQDDFSLESDTLIGLSGQVAQISISHDFNYATAVCLAAQEPREGDVGGEAAARNI